MRYTDDLTELIFIILCLSCCQFPHLTAERDRAKCSSLGSYPSPDQSLHPSLYLLNSRQATRQQYRRSDSAGGSVRGNHSYTYTMH